MIDRIIPIIPSRHHSIVASQHHTIMLKDLDHKKLTYIGIIVIAFGILFNTTIDMGALGTVFIAIGGLLFISAMARKRKEEEEQKED